jgi:tetratricopeptide (TPR) repeat protein
MAESYYQQSQRRLEAARAAARRATELAPDSGFAWTRLAELEFSFGRIREARTALARGLGLAPRHAQAHALRGYLLSADHEIEAAKAAFEEALRIDGALGNAWLGLGLVKFKQGDRAGGRADMQIAATSEPTRAFFYSYHGKALGAVDAGRLALKDLALAKQIDPDDPTPWLYSAIEYQQQNRFNAAVSELEESLRLNDNRRVYRSQFLLDQDRAVRRANLAAIYRNAGLVDLAVREATRAVETDYTNPSAHLFLANSFDALRDPRRLNLSYETAWVNELLLAHLLAPVGGGALSQFVSQQEYSRLLDADGLGGSFLTEWRERGRFEQRASLFGTFGRVSAGVDYASLNDDGERANNFLRRRELHAQAKVQVSSADAVYALGQWQTQENGDLLRNYANLPRSRTVRYDEKLLPGLLLLGWNHRWAPGVHTLLLGGRLAARESFRDANTPQLLLERSEFFLRPDFVRLGASGQLEYTSATLRNAVLPPLSGVPVVVSEDFQRAIAPFLGRAPITGVFSERFTVGTRRRFEVFTAELQQIWQATRHTAIVGARAQGGEFDTRARLDLENADNAPVFMSPASLQSVTVDFARAGVYAYDFFNVARGLTVLAGVAWDRIERPENFRNPPVSDRRVETSKTSGKVGFTFAPSSAMTVRGIYAEALGGVSFDESVRLEPVQLAGFNQAFRTVISESIAGSVEAPRYRNVGLSASGALPKRVWWSASFNRLEERATRTVGVFDLFSTTLFPNDTVALPTGMKESLAYREDVGALEVNHLIGREFAVGASYRETRAKLRTRATDIPMSFTAGSDLRDRAVLREVTVHANWNSPAGGFARIEATRYAQAIESTVGGRSLVVPPGDEFIHVSVQGGWRFQRNRHEIGAGVLNLTDREPHLSPLTQVRELSLRRTMFVRCRFNF